MQEPVYHTMTSNMEEYINASRLAGTNLLNMSSTDQ